MSKQSQVSELITEVNRLAAKCDRKTKTIAELEADNERLRADCKDKQRLIETQQQYLDNKDSVIKGMNEMIAELEVEAIKQKILKDHYMTDNKRLRAVRDAVIKHRDNKAFLNVDTWQACVARAEETLKESDDE